MDPVGPWSAYAQYNRLAGVQGTPTAGELHHHLTTSAAAAAASAGSPATTTAQLLPGGFLSPPPVGYEVFPFLHHAGAKNPAHYVAQHRQALAQAQAAAASKQGDGAPWNQSSPFGILPHESVATTTSKTTYENFNAAHFAAAQSLNHLNSQLAAKAGTAAASSRAQSPQVTTSTSKNASQASPSNNTSATRNIEKTFAAPKNTQSSLSPGQNTIQTKAQTKIYPDLANQTERNRNTAEENAATQNSPISFSIMDSPGRLNYSGSNNSGKRPPQFQHNYRQHYQQANSSSEEFQRPKSGSDYASNGPDCNVVVPRRPSPLQAHSQASPIGHAQSPAYPLYNSPLNSISSPQHANNSSNQDRSPLDASVPRNSSSSQQPAPTAQNIAYPSQSSSGQQQQQNCNWPEARRKYPNSQFAQNAAVLEIPNRQIELTRVVEQQQRPNDRQQTTYFDSSGTHQITLQDLSSCRGDPMSIVKNLQQQQQSCQVQADVKPDVKAIKPIKRRNSNDVKPPVIPDLHIAGRIPPPAHTPATQQQQNGAYFDFERWNLPPPQKMFATQAMHQQPGLMLGPHGHPVHAPLPYFTPFPMHHEGFGGNVELTPLTTYNEQQQQAANQYQQQQQQQQQVQEDQPKVVVPNIEEELNFLSEGTVRRPATAVQMPQKPLVPTPGQSQTPASANKPPDSGSTGFMSSYLKFLQGERDTSPPPVSRGGRKQSWTRKPNNEGMPPGPHQGQPMPPMHGDMNGLAAPVQSHVNPIATPIVPPIQRLSTHGDPQDDPRYFPLPKERNKKAFESSSDDGMSDEDDFFGRGKKGAVPPTTPKDPNIKAGDKSSKKGRPPKPPGSEKDKKEKQKRGPKPKKDEKEDLNNLPKREATKRAAKEKKSLTTILKDEEPDEPIEFQDSEDSDPAWTPMAKKDDDEEELILPLKKNKRKGQVKQKKGMKNLIAAAAQGAGIGVNDALPDVAKKKANQNTAPTLEDNIAASMQKSAPPEDQFKAGDFVVIKADLSQPWPAIWRVDGKTLLQKYEPFEQNGQTFYKNISTYTSWTPESKKQYITIPIKYRMQNQSETVVEFLKHELTIIDPEYHEKCMRDFEAYQDNFEVYIQTLISQSLDSNFLLEIFSEKDEYFLSNVRTIDEISQNKAKTLFQILHWPTAITAAISTWPCFNLIKENGSESQKFCNACGRMEIHVRVLMYGQPYNSSTLEGCQPDPNAIYEKDFLMCRTCSGRVELANKITHQKYLMYIECAKKVADKRAFDQTKDTTCILNELLADESWLNKLFIDVRTLWAEIDCIEYSVKKNSVT